MSALFAMKVKMKTVITTIKIHTVFRCISRSNLKEKTNRNFNLHTGQTPPEDENTSHLKTINYSFRQILSSQRQMTGQWRYSERYLPSYHIEFFWESLGNVPKKANVPRYVWGIQRRWEQKGRLLETSVGFGQPSNATDSHRSLIPSHGKEPDGNNLYNRALPFWVWSVFVRYCSLVTAGKMWKPREQKGNFKKGGGVEAIKVSKMAFSARLWWLHLEQRRGKEQRQG